MGKVTTNLTVTNHIDQILAERGFLTPDEIRSVELRDVLVDTGTNNLCLPADVINQLGVPLYGEVDAKLAVGLKTLKVYKEIELTIGERSGTFRCVELPPGESPLLGLIPLEDLGLEPNLQTQKLRFLPETGQETYVMVLSLAVDMANPS
ncbi:MAG: aspartyl protease [Cyanobacteria bacterium P01_F01_bin.86]